MSNIGLIPKVDSALVPVSQPIEFARDQQGNLYVSINGQAYAQIPFLSQIPQSQGFSNPMTNAGDLIVGGAGGAPSRLGIGSDGQVPTPVGGTEVWSGGTLLFFKNNGVVSVNNTGVETTLFGSGVGSLSIPGGSLSAGAVLRIRFGFRLTSTDAGGATLKLYYGATLVYNRPTPNWNGANIVVQGEILFQVETIGAAATGRTQLSAPASGPNVITGATSFSMFDDDTPPNFNTTLTQSLNMTFQWGNGTQTMDCTYLAVEKL